MLASRQCACCWRKDAQIACGRAVVSSFDLILCRPGREEARDRSDYRARTFLSDQTVPNTSFENNTVRSGDGLSFDFSYAQALQSYKWGSVWVEIPVLWNPDEDLNYGLNQVPLGYSSLFLTPAARVRFLEGLAFQPWLSFGGGVSRFVASKDLLSGGTNPGPRITTTGVLDGSIGLDVPLGRKLHNAIFRFEARDNWSGAPPINVDTGKTRQHNLYVGGGMVFAF